MAYEISFRSGVETAFENLGSEATNQIQQKLDRVASCEFRSPTDWEYTTWSGQSTGKFNWGSYRVFADVNEDTGEIVVHDVRHRENLYR
jgi:mRNA interferase RelE/StbE